MPAERAEEEAGRSYGATAPSLRQLLSTGNPYGIVRPRRISLTDAPTGSFYRQVIPTGLATWRSRSAIHQNKCD